VGFDERIIGVCSTIGMPLALNAVVHRLDAGCWKIALPDPTDTIDRAYEVVSTDLLGFGMQRIAEDSRTR
jgi:hypothetical protein